MKKFLSICVTLMFLVNLASCGATSPPAGSEAPVNNPDTPAVTEQTPQAMPHSSSTETSVTDDRGIPGMNSFALLTVLSGDPFEIPAGELTPAGAEDSYCAFTCVSYGGGEGSGVMYDYSLTMDSDEEIIGASFGIASTTASERKLLTAADLYFYAVSLLQYDTADTEALTAWFAENLSAANGEAIEITIGDAHFELYGIPGYMYWVDISKI